MPRRAVLAPRAARGLGPRAAVPVAPLPLGAGRWATGRRVACRSPLWLVAAAGLPHGAGACGLPSCPPSADRLDLRRLCLSSNEPPAAWWMHDVVV